MTVGDPSGPHVSHAGTCDLLIAGGEVVDGLGGPRYRADVAVSGDRIVAVGRLQGWRGAKTIDAAGMVVAPGFIDVHTHDDSALLATPEMAAKVSQGVTTVVVGNCGISLAPARFSGPPPSPLDLLGEDGAWFRFETFAEYLAALAEEPPAVNALPLVGHQTLRARHVAALDRPSSEAEIGRMAEDVDEAMRAGAGGFSSGLEYGMSLAASTHEVTCLARVAAEHGGIYCTHIRDERDGIVSAMQEALRIGRDAGLPVVLSHHKLAGARNHGRSRETLAVIDAAMAGQEVAFDVYPYAAGSSSVTPGDVGDFRIVITRSGSHPELVGRDLAGIAGDWGCTQAEAVARLAPVGGIYHLMDDGDVRRILAHPAAMIGSDGLPFDTLPHPRLWGTFPRVLGHYARDLGLMSQEEAVRRMTSLPAQVFGLTERGVIAAGALADLVLFDPAGIADRATYEAPTRPAAGIGTVIVNGRCVWRDGAATGDRPGRILRREPRGGGAAGATSERRGFPG